MSKFHDSKQRTVEEELDVIIAELDADRNTFPDRSIRSAQRRAGEITPRLVGLIQKATEMVHSGDIPKGRGHLFALYLLTEFEAKEALPAIIEAVSLPDEGPFDLFGDAITEDLRRILAALSAENREVIDNLIADQRVNEYVRSAAAKTYLHFVRDGHLSREEAVRRLGGHLSEANAHSDAEVAHFLIAALSDFSPREVYDEVKEAYRLDLVDPFDVRLENVEQSIREGDARFQMALEHCPATGVSDTLEELKGWAAFGKR